MDLERMGDAHKSLWLLVANEAATKMGCSADDVSATKIADRVVRQAQILEAMTFVQEIGKSISTTNKTKLKSAHAAMTSATSQISTAMDHISSLMDDPMEIESFRNVINDIEHPSVRVDQTLDPVGKIGRAKISLAEAGKILAQDDSFDSTRYAVSNALRQRAMSDMAKQGMANLAAGADASSMYDMMDYSCMPYVRDMYPEQVIYAVGQQLYQCDYKINSDDSVTLGDPVTVEVSYVPAPAEANELPQTDSDDVDEAATLVTLEGELIQLSERAVAKDGTANIKLISPGWGSSGYYSEKMLKRDGPKVFPKGLHMYINHPTEEEERSRPERDVRDLAGVLESSAEWKDNGPTGPGLYAKAKVFDTYKNCIDEAAPYIGTSIRAAGRASEGSVDGRLGQIIEGLVEGYSCDYVTLPGRGGEVLPLIEAARKRNFGDAKVIVEKENAVNEEDLKKLQESSAKMAKQLEESNTELARIKEAMLLRDARDVVVGVLANIDMPNVSRARLTESCSKNPPIKDGVLDTEALTEATKAVAVEEMKYLASAAGYGSDGKVSGVGSVSEAEISEEDIDKMLSESLGAIGFSSNVVKIAVNGRG